MTTKFFALTIVAFLTLSCNKKSKDPEPTPTPTPAPIVSADTTAPVIVLNGKIMDTCYLQSPYVNPGATCTDNVDGNITNYIIVSGAVNHTLVGNYILNYNARDAAGNNAVTATRTIHVENAANFLAGNYNVTCSYSVQISSGNPTITISNYNAMATSSGTVNNLFSIDSLKVTNLKGKANCYITGNNFTTSTYESGFTTGSSSATISASKSSFTIETLTYEQMYPSRTHRCLNVFTKQ